MANLTTDKNLDKHLRPVKSGGEDTSLELATKGNLTRITGDLELDGDINGLGIFNNVIESSSDIDLLASRGISLKAGGGDFDIDAFGDVNISLQGTGGNYTITSDPISKPDIIFKSTSTYAIGPDLFFRHFSATPANSDKPGTIYFQGYNDNDETITWATILSEVVNVADSSELGKLTLKVAAISDCAGLILEGHSSARVDATIGNGAASLTTIAGDLDIDGDTITSAGALEIDAGGAVSITGQDVDIDATKQLNLSGGGDTYLKESSADKLEIFVGGDEMLTLDEANQRVTIEADKLSYKIGSGGDEFSPTDSAYAGMILGCSHVFGSGTGGQFQTVSTAWESLLWDTDKYALVTFVVPPSNKVKISVHFPWVQAAGIAFQLGLATDSSATSLNAKYQNDVDDANRSDSFNINYSWVVDGSDHSWSAGETKTLYIMAYAASTIRFYTGGTNAGGYGGVIVEATALPATIGDGSEP